MNCPDKFTSNFRHSYVDMFRMLDNEEKGYVSITELLQSLQNNEVSVSEFETIRSLDSVWLGNIWYGLKIKIAVINLRSMSQFCFGTPLQFMVIEIQLLKLNFSFFLFTFFTLKLLSSFAAKMSYSIRKLKLQEILNGNRNLLIRHLCFVVEFSSVAIVPSGI